MARLRRGQRGSRADALAWAVYSGSFQYVNLPRNTFLLDSQVSPVATGTYGSYLLKVGRVRYRWEDVRILLRQELGYVAGEEAPDAIWVREFLWHPNYDPKRLTPARGAFARILKWLEAK